MNYKYLTLEELNEFSKQFEDYSLCEILFSVLKSMKPDADISWLFFAEDRVLLTAIENAKLKEKEDE